MASHQQQAAQGSDSNQLQLKKDECVNKCNDAASDASGQAQMKREEYGNKASETASHASNTAQTKGHEAASEAGNKAEGTKDALMHKSSDATESAKDNSTVQAAQTYAIELKDQASTLLQQTGEQVKNIAAGAAESIKSTWSGNNNNTGNNTNNAAAASGGGSNADSPLINQQNPKP